MPASVTVWVVPLVPRASMQGVKGSLTITDEALAFTPADDADDVRRWALVEVTRVRRLRGSPVLLVASEGPRGPERVAFYFVEPPPLEPPEDAWRPALMPVGRPSKRRVRRRNATYLGMANRDLRGLLREWERRVGAAVQAAKRAPA
jgi:hypothetical protein